jgi:hypothetical protein
VLAPNPRHGSPFVREEHACIGVAVVIGVHRGKPDHDVSLKRAVTSHPDGAHGVVAHRTLEHDIADAESSSSNHDDRPGCNAHAMVDAPLTSREELGVEGPGTGASLRLTLSRRRTQPSFPSRIRHARGVGAATPFGVVVLRCVAGLSPLGVRMARFLVVIRRRRAAGLLLVTGGIGG